MSDITNFLKIRIFNLEQKIKSNSMEQIRLIDVFLKEAIEIESGIQDQDLPKKTEILINLQQYKAYLLLVRQQQGELFNYIDYYYKVGNPQIGVFKSEEEANKSILSLKVRKEEVKKPKSVRKKKKTKDK